MKTHLQCSATHHCGHSGAFLRAIVLMILASAMIAPATADKSVAPNPPSGETVRFAVLSDVHFYDVKLGTGTDEFDNYLAADPKLLHLSEPIFEAALADIMQRNVRFVIIPGDLTKDGEVLNHVGMTQHLQKLEKAGIEVFVVPGNHDINNSDGVEFRLKGTKPVPGASPEVFRALYQRFGYGKALDHAPDSLSYVAEPAPGLWLLALDSVKYAESALVGRPLGSGRLSADTMTWALAKLQQAQLAGKKVIAFMHHGVNPHFLAEPQVFPDFLVDNWRGVSAQLAGAGLKVIFTGHYHSQDASAWTLNLMGNVQPSALCDIETGSLVLYPCAFRIAELDSAGHLHVESRRVTAIAADLDGDTFQHYAETFARTLLPYQVYAYLAAMFGITVQQAQAVIPSAVVNAIIDGLIANYAGDESPSLQTQMMLANLLGQAPGSNEHTLGTLLYTLWYEPPLPATDNTVDVSI
jgi:hypothetical protein